MINKLSAWRFNKSVNRLQIAIGQNVLKGVRDGRFDLESYLIFQWLTREVLS